MFWPRLNGLRQILQTSSFRQATTLAFICLLVSLGSVLLCNHLLEMVTRSHVRDMVLMDMRNQQESGRLLDSGALAQSLVERLPYERRTDEYELVLDPRGQTLFGSPSLRPLLACVPGCLEQWQRVVLQLPERQESEILGLLVKLGDGGYYFSAFDLRPMLERTRIIPLMTGAGLLLILLFILLCSLPFGVRNLMRVNHVLDTLERFATGEHAARVARVQGSDEFDQLGREVNSALGRINRLMEEVRSITSHIAHELRTPLTRLQSQLDTALENNDGPAREAILQAVAESERIQRLFTAVMRLGEVETGRCRHRFEAIDLHELVQDVAEYYQPLAEAGGSCIRCELARGASLVGDRALLFQSLANLIDNALKYAPGSEVRLFYTQNGMTSVLGVADTGQGIPEQDVARATQRFERLQQTGSQGFGLGLSLTRAICDLHGGELRLADNRPGLVVTLHLPTRQ